jgi:Uma2 family endonuclease
MSAAEKYIPTYTVTDYQQWKGDWELWDGVAIAMSPSPFGRHQIVAGALYRSMGNQIETGKCRATLLYEIDWVVRNNTVVRPDMVVLCGGAPERHVEIVPAIVVEVLSDTTRQNDLSYKRALYREQQVHYYVIVDPEGETVTVDVLRNTGGYESVAVDGNIELMICEHCSVQIRPEEIFRT